MTKKVYTNPTEWTVALNTVANWLNSSTMPKEEISRLMDLWFEYNTVAIGASEQVK
jgi:hypothetical protein